MIAEEDIDVDDEFDLEVLLDALSADDTLDLGYRHALCERLVTTSELWIVELYTYFAGIRDIDGHRHNQYGVTIPGFTTFLVGSADDLSGAFRLCEMLEKKGVVHIYPAMMQRQ